MGTEIHFISTFITLVLISILGLRVNKNINSSKDFSVGGRNLNCTQVSGSIIATIVGGASTIGTAQLAFQSGINAIWFTLGASIACVFLGIFMAIPLRRLEVETVPQILENRYGNNAGIAASIITSIAIFMHIVGQILSSVSIFTSMFDISSILAMFITISLILSYIFFGGFLGTSIVGIVKTFLLYLTLLISSGIVLDYFEGLSGFFSYYPSEPWFNLFSGGVYSGLALGFSMVIGVTSTQTYLQALFSGKDEKASRNGAFLSALLIPPVGAICTLIGMFMRATNIDISPKEVLPTFILNYLNPWIGGLTIAALIISVIGTGAGLILGISTMINRDIYLKKINPNANDRTQLRVMRISVCIISILAIFMVIVNMESLILKWGFLSMTLRGTTVFIPLLMTIYYKGNLDKFGGVVAIISAPIIAILWEIFGSSSIDSLYVGLSLSIIIFILSIFKGSHVSRNC